MKLHPKLAPIGLIIQPDCLLVPGRPGFVASGDHWHWMEVFEYEEDNCADLIVYSENIRGVRHTEDFDRDFPLDLDYVSIPRWDLSSLSERELDSLQVAIDAQRTAGIGNKVPATKAEQSILRKSTC